MLKVMSVRAYMAIIANSEKIFDRSKLSYLFVNPVHLANVSKLMYFFSISF